MPDILPRGRDTEYAAMTDKKNVVDEFSEPWLMICTFGPRQYPPIGICVGGYLAEKI